jgi:hypothetical protein
MRAHTYTYTSPRGRLSGVSCNNNATNFLDSIYDTCALDLGWLESLGLEGPTDLRSTVRGFFINPGGQSSLTQGPKPDPMNRLKKTVDEKNMCAWPMSSYA